MVSWRLRLVIFSTLLMRLLAVTDDSDFVSPTDEESPQLEGEENICIDTTREINSRPQGSIIKDKLYRRCCIFYYQEGNSCKKSWFLITVNQLVTIWIFLPLLFGVFMLFLIFSLLCLCRQNNIEAGNFYRNSPLLSRTNCAPRPPTSAPPSYNEAVPGTSTTYNIIEPPGRIHNSNYLIGAMSPENFEMKSFERETENVMQGYYESIDVGAPGADDAEEPYATITKIRKPRKSIEV